MWLVNSCQKFRDGKKVRPGPADRRQIEIEASSAHPPPPAPSLPMYPVRSACPVVAPCAVRGAQVSGTPKCRDPSKRLSLLCLISDVTTGIFWLAESAPLMKFLPVSVLFYICGVFSCFLFISSFLFFCRCFCNSFFPFWF